MVTSTTARVDNETDFDPLLPADAAAILGGARALLREASKGLSNAPLKGKQLGLMCATESNGDSVKGDSENGDAAFFRLAATRLGAHVARIRPGLAANSSAFELGKLALMLGRLYDAVECQGMSAELVKRIRAQAGVPVYLRLAGAGHPTAALANQLDGEGRASPREMRLVVLQAALLRSLAGLA